jgi:hypothetical protein
VLAATTAAAAGAMVREIFAGVKVAAGLLIGDLSRSVHSDTY